MASLGYRGANLIRGEETLRLSAYLPTPGDVWTLGWGHTRGVKPGDVCTVEQARLWFIEDTADAVAAVSNLHVSLTQSMQDALISLVYNVGASAISAKSTIGRALLEKDYYAAWAGFTLWRKQAGHDLLGLARRRAREMSLFLGDGLP